MFLKNHHNKTEHLTKTCIVCAMSMLFIQVIFGSQILFIIGTPTDKTQHGSVLQWHAKSFNRKGPVTIDASFECYRCQVTLFSVCCQQLHEHATYLVDALWDVNPMLKDWKAMTDLLLDETVRDDRKFSHVLFCYFATLLFCFLYCIQTILV